MKTILMWVAIFSFFGFDQKNSGEVEKYVSMMCQTGDITLTLDPNKTFDLTILLWDGKTNKHTGKESIKGSWIKTGKILILTSSDKNTIKYELATTNMKIGATEINSKTYAFKSNNKTFFATGYDLLEQKQTDSFLKSKINTTEKKK